jgi:hypothetical protein
VVSVDDRRRKQATVADPQAREFLRKADAVLTRAIDAHPDFRPRAWIDELPGLDAFGTLISYLFASEFDERSRPDVAEATDERG